MSDGSVGMVSGMTFESKIVGLRDQGCLYIVQLGLQGWYRPSEGYRSLHV